MCCLYSSAQVISCDQNLNRCCELIELTAKIQGQLFTILNFAAAEGKYYPHSPSFPSLISHLGSIKSIL